MRIDEDRVFWHGRIYSQKQIQTLRRNSFKNMTPEKHRELSSRGGKASARSREVNKAKERLIQEYTKCFLQELERDAAREKGV